jgi:hypothetical protein
MDDQGSSYQPFQPDNVAPVRGGCAKAALFGCGGFLVLVLVAVVIIAFNVEKITAWTFDVFEKQVMARLPSDVEDAEVQRIRQGFADVRHAIADGTVDPLALNQLQPVILRFADPNRRPQPEDVERLVELLEAAAGGGAAAPAAQEAPPGEAVPEPAQ